MFSTMTMIDCNSVTIGILPWCPNGYLTVYKGIQTEIDEALQ